jgi:hypothetical protein
VLLLPLLVSGFGFQVTVTKRAVDDDGLRVETPALFVFLKPDT